MIIDSGSIDNLVSTEMVEKLELETTTHRSPYKFSWLQKGHQVMVSQQCKVEFKTGGYKYEIPCDVIPMDVWGDHGNLIGMSFMMGEGILILWRKMVEPTCYCQYKRIKKRKNPTQLYFS
jgi:hypothetical protein